VTFFTFSMRYAGLVFYGFINRNIVTLKGKNMKKNLCITMSFKIIVLVLIVLVFVPNVCYAQDSGGRAGKFELYGSYGIMGGDNAEFLELGEYVNLDAAYFYGFGAGYNLDEHLNLNTQFMFSSPDAKFHPGLFSGEPVIKEDADIFRWDVNLDWNMLNRRLTPVLSGGLGYINADMFGDSQSDISYNFGLGGRWDMNDKLFIKAMLNFMWTDLDTRDTWLFTSFGFNFGWRF
jgi:hypothetical protein